MNRITETTARLERNFSPDLVNPVNLVYFFSNRQQQITAELLSLIQPGARARESSFSSQLRNVRQIILVRVLSMNLFTLTELNFHLKLAYRDGLLARAFNVDLNAAHCFVIEGAVLESPQIEVAAQFAIDARQHV